MSLCSSTVTDSLLHLSVRNVGAYCDQIFVDQNRTSLFAYGIYFGQMDSSHCRQTIITYVVDEDMVYSIKAC